jgi:anti-sigma B factor antagonist
VNFKMDTYTLDGGVPVITLKGEVDVYTAPQLKQQMITLLEAGAKQMLIDLTNVEYFDSTALGVLIGGLKRIRERDGSLSLLCPNPRIRRVFEITGLDKIFEIYGTMDEAIAGVASFSP